jgi:adenylosuccinate lyase
VERVILPDSCILTDYLLAKTLWLVRDMRVNPQFMRRNLDLTRGLVFSGQLLLDLAAAGMTREHAYKVVQSHAMASWEAGSDFRAAIDTDPEIRKHLTSEQVARSFGLDRQLKNVDAIFARVFGS